MPYTGWTARAILEVLDDAAAGYDFPMLDNGYVYPVDVRLSAYGDKQRWALVVEWLGVGNRNCEFDTSLYCYGNCLTAQRSEQDFVTPEAYRAWRDQHRFDETLFLHPVGDGPTAPLLDPDRYLDVNPGAKDLTIRGQVVAIPRDSEVYRAHGVTLEAPPRIRLYELMRCLLPEQRPLLVAAEEEIRRVVPDDLRLLLRLDAWRHPNLADDQLPSRTQTFRMIASVLATGEVDRYRPPRRPNTHWSHWPGGGTL
jgi:hypothetical protein